MKKSRFSAEQVVGLLKQAEAGMAVKELCRKGGFSDATFYKWRARFGGMQASDTKATRRLPERQAEAVTIRQALQVKSERAGRPVTLPHYGLLFGKFLCQPPGERSPRGIAHFHR